jgi:hypothetical protein
MYAFTYVHLYICVYAQLALSIHEFHIHGFNQPQVKSI